MKDQYKYKKGNKKRGIYLTISFFVIAVFFYSFPEPIFNLFTFGSHIKHNTSLSVVQREDLFLENQDLKAKIEIYEDPGNLFFFYKNENEALKQQLGYQEFSQDSRKILRVMNVDSSNIYNTLLIKNSPEIKVGDLVFYKFNLQIGKLINKIGDVAQVEIFSQAGVKNNFHMYDGGILKMEVEGVGQGGGVIRVDAPRDVDFENASKVFLTNTKNSSYLVAELVDEIFKTQDTNKVLYFRVFTNPDLLSQVEIQPHNNTNIDPINNL